MLVAVGFSLVFIKVYDSYDPFEDSSAGSSKNLAQWQYFGVFSLVLLLKTGIVSNGGSIWFTFLFLVALFANAIVDAFYLLQALCDPNRAGHAKKRCGGTNTLSTRFKIADHKRRGLSCEDIAAEEVEMPDVMKSAHAMNT